MMPLPNQEEATFDPARKAAMLSLLERVIAEEEPQRPKVRLPAAIGMGVAAALIGGTAAAYVAQRPVTEHDVVHCLATAELNRSTEYAGASVAVADYRKGTIPIDDALAACDRLWSDGILDPSSPSGVRQPWSRGRSATVPARLTVCVMDDGTAAVLPGGPQVCVATGLAEVADQ